MTHAGVRRHAMKMGCGGLARASHAMNMAWPKILRSTMVRPLVHTPIVGGIPMTISAHLASAALSLALLTATAFLPASAQSGPSPQEQMACRSDAGKFCADHIGKPPQMNACLRENKARLSEACRKVVESRGG
jgi:hypothetical protein